MITNNYNIKINKREIYNGVYEYSVEEGYVFESYGCRYGNHIYGLDKLDNPYTIVKIDEDNSNNNNDINTD